METLYYRKIAEIVLRDEEDMALREAAIRVLALPRDRKSNVAKTDRRKLKAYMHKWCDRAEARLKELES